MASLTYLPSVHVRVSQHLESSPSLVIPPTVSLRRIPTLRWRRRTAIALSRRIRIIPIRRLASIPLRWEPSLRRALISRRLPITPLLHWRRTPIRHRSLALRIRIVLVLLWCALLVRHCRPRGRARIVESGVGAGEGAGDGLAIASCFSAQSRRLAEFLPWRVAAEDARHAGKAGHAAAVAVGLG